MRVIDEKNLRVTIRDNKTGDDVLFCYHNPTTEQRAAYHNDAIKRKGKRVEFRSTQARIKHGLPLIDSIGDNYLARRQGKDLIPISSDPQSKNYDPDWKGHLVRTAPEMVETFGAYLFDSPAEALEEEEDEETGEGHDPAFEDPEKNSSATSGL